MEWFTPEKIEAFATTCGTIAFAMYIAWRTFKAKLDAKLKEQKDLPTMIKAQSLTDKEVNEAMERLKESCGADRVQLYEFHNGIHYANGRSALKTTCTYEVCRYGVASSLSMLSGIPTSCIPNFLNVLLNNGELEVKDLEDIRDEMPATYGLKHNMGITSFYDVVITNCEGQPVGFVAVQFCDGKQHEINKDEVKRLAWFIESKLSQM